MSLRLEGRNAGLRTRRLGRRASARSRLPSWKSTEATRSGSTTLSGKGPDIGIYPLTDIGHAVAIVRAVPDREQRIAKINELLQGSWNHKTAGGKALGTRRALLCTRLAAEKLWPD